MMSRGRDLVWLSAGPLALGLACLVILSHIPGSAFTSFVVYALVLEIILGLIMLSFSLYLVVRGRDHLQRGLINLVWPFCSVWTLCFLLLLIQSFGRASPGSGSLRTAVLFLMIISITFPIRWIAGIVKIAKSLGSTRDW
jgi:hypothetical protein